MTRGIALLTASTLTVFVLIVGAGVAWHLQAADGDAAASDTADLAATGATALPPADRSPHEDRQPDGSGRARAGHMASSEHSLPWQAGPATASDGHATALERKRRSGLQSERSTADYEDSTTPARSERRSSRGDRDD